MHIELGFIDYLIILIYFVFVLGIGFLIKRTVKTSNDFLMSDRSIPLWITSLAFVSANLGAQELIGMGASGAKYGIMSSHFYWVGAIPAMIFLGVFMMPFYYGSRARSVPEYLALRFDEKTRGLNAISFAAMTIFSSGISLYALALLLESILGWNFNASILLAAVIVMVYTLLGGLTSAVYNEVLQFFLIMLGIAPQCTPVCYVCPGYVLAKNYGQWRLLGITFGYLVCRINPRAHRSRRQGRLAGSRAYILLVHESELRDCFYRLDNLLCYDVCDQSLYVPETG